MTTRSPSARRVGVLAVVLTSVLWGTTGTAAAFAPGAGPLAIGSAALGIGGLLQAIIALPALRRSSALLRESRGAVALGAVAVAVYPLAFYSSMHLAGVAIGSVVSLALAPLATGVVERVVDGRRLGARWLGCAVAGALGAATLGVSRDDGAAGSPARTAIGAGLGVLAATTYATYSWASHRLMAAGAPRSAAMGAVFGAGGLLLMPVLALTGAPLLATREATAVAAYMALVPMFLGYVLFGIGLARVPASTATTITLLEPAVAALLAVVVLGERLTALGWAGLALLAAVLIVLVTGPQDAGGRPTGAAPS